MATDKQPITIKKYANRRLYDTGTSAYVTLDDLGQMVKSGQDFLVYDAKSGEDITRSVLTQIIFEQESKGGNALLPVTFLRQLIRFYGDSMQTLVPSYLEFTLDRFASEQQKFRQQWAEAITAGPMGASSRQMFESLEDQTRKNMTMFQQALQMFSPFGSLGMAAEAAKPEPPRSEEARSRADIDILKRQIADLQHKIEGLASKG